MPYADLTDCRCYYELRGEGEPLLLIPGLGCTARFWDPFADELARHFSLIMPETRGVGRSEARRPARSLSDYTADLVELLDHLQVERTHVLGQSLGGIVAQRFAGQHAERIERLVLISCARRFGPYLREITMLVGRTMRYFPRRVFLRAMALLGAGPLWLDANPRVIDEKIELEIREGIERRALVNQMRCLQTHEEAIAANAIKVPTLVIAGEHDMLIPSCYARQMAEAIPDSRFMLVAGAGHNPPLESPQRVLPAIASFLLTGEPSLSEPHFSAA